MQRFISGSYAIASDHGVFSAATNKIGKTKPARQIENLDEILFPSRHLVEKYEYGFMLDSKVSKGKTSILTSRGCPNDCRFCQVSCIIPKYRSRSVSNITDEIETIINEGYETLIFVDDNLLANKTKIMKIMDYIIHKDTDLKLWVANSRVDSANKELYEKLRDAGVDHITFGIESGNQDVLDFYNKRITLEQTRNAVQLSKKMGFFISGNFILGAPIETEEHIENTIKFAKDLQLDVAVFYKLSYAYKSQLWNEAYEAGKIKEDEYSVSADSNRGLSNFTDDELSNYSMKAFKSFYFNPQYLSREIYHAFSKRDFSYLKIGLKMWSNQQ